MDNFKIEKIEIKYHRKGNAQSTDMDGLCHVKVLPYLSVAQSYVGSYDIRLGNDKAPTLKTGAGGFFIAPSNIPQTIVHRADESTGVMWIRWIFLDIVINGKYRPDHLYDFPIVIPEKNREEMNSLFCELFSSNDVCDTYSIYYRIIKLLLSLGTPKRSLKSKTVKILSDYIEEHYRADITVSDLAKAVYMSESNLYALFKKEFGMPPLSYINHYRLSLAAELLLQSGAHVCDIAENVGFTDPLYFSKMFKKQYGSSPKEYRRINGI